MKRLIHEGLVLGLAVLAILSLAQTALAQTASSQQAPVRGIERIAGDVYRFRNNHHYSVFMVTPEGVIATDPINADAARWLKGEIARRFAKPVKYLIYSHDHADHIAGGEVFADTATVIAHDNATAHIIGERRPTVAPDVTFSDRMTLTLGGKVVELIHLGSNHSDNMIVMRFPAERILFAVDIVARNTIGFRDFPNVDIDGLIATLKRVEALDFDILAPGHGSLGSRADVAPHRRYIETLRARVLAHMRAGKTVDEIKSLVTMEEYESWAGYGPWRALNVEGMVRHLKLYRRPN